MKKILIIKKKPYICRLKYIEKRMGKSVRHEGTVASICGNTMIVRIVAPTACGGCSAHGYCMPFGNRDKDIRVEGFSGDFVSGEQVSVVMQQSSGIKALCIGYVMPFVVVLTALIVVYNITGNELASGLAALLVLVPYYLILKMFNQKLSKHFGFIVQKI